MKEMDNIKESGLLERYLLGELSSSEEIQLEKKIKEDDDLKQYLEQLELNFEQMARENAITPPHQVKESLLSTVTKDPSSDEIDNSSQTSLKSYLAIAASLALLFCVSSFWLYNRLNSIEENLRLVQDENLELKNNYDRLEENLNETSKWYTTVNSPNAEKYILKGNDISPDAVAVSYINHANKTVVLNAGGLPQLDDDHDYQLWADVKGEMIDMGVIPKNSEMIAMKYIENSESLNITIEPAGGNDHPTVERLISNVYL